MKQFTIEERNEIYKKALLLIQNNKFTFMCPAIHFQIVQYLDYPLGLEVFYSDYLPQFVELISKKPIKLLNVECWWDIHDVHSRVNCLKECIKQTEDKLE